jgi:hypothetical protein
LRLRLKGGKGGGDVSLNCLYLIVSASALSALKGPGKSERPGTGNWNFGLEQAAFASLAGFADRFKSRCLLVRMFSLRSMARRLGISVIFPIAIRKSGSDKED